MKNFMPPTAASTGNATSSRPELGVQVKNPLEIVEGNAVRLLLGGGGYAVIDLADLPKVAGYRWSRDRGYARTAIKIGGKKTTMRLHQLLMSPADGQVVDHRDGDRGELPACQPAPLHSLPELSQSCWERGEYDWFQATLSCTSVTALYLAQNTPVRGQEPSHRRNCCHDRGGAHYWANHSRTYAVDLVCFKRSYFP